ncbi:3-deoxy-D-manno-octulosonic acid transferase [Nitrospira sp.]|nr:3-deoxy-D-manno-octulosonic acid transferase [Nitrospira sp.]
MAFWLYNILLVLGAPVIVAVMLAKARCRPGLPYRWGLRSPVLEAGRTPSSQVVWIHAVSLGEVVAVVPLVKSLHARDPTRTIVVSTVTETGREAVVQRLEGTATHCYAPLDFPWVVRRFIRTLRPSVYVFVETELWPNLLTAMDQARVPTVLVNGRISSRSFARQQWPGVRHVYARLLEKVSMCLMQSDRDAARIVALGAQPERVRRVGNIKFDQPLPTVAPAQLDAIRRWFERTPGGHVLVAGSTHPGEEEVLLRACMIVKEQFPDFHLVLAPRHIERAGELVHLIRSHNMGLVRRSQLNTLDGDEDSWILLLDSRGELGAVYQFATVTFVGGTLVPVGGHNLLEPAAWGKPVLFGPHTDHCQDIANLLEGAGGGVRVAGRQELVHTISRWFTDPISRDQAGRIAEQTVRENRGALQQCQAVVESFLESGSGQRASPQAVVHGQSMRIGPA